jgi:hypothetical protein
MSPKFIWHEPKNLLAYDLSELIESDNIIHVKGFASGLDFKHPQNVHQQQLFFEAIRLHCEFHDKCAVVFDGDSYHSDSFTYLLAQLPLQLNHITFYFLAVVRTVDEAPRFETTWQDSGLSTINIVPTSHLSATSPYETLGIDILTSSRSAVVFCIGGGDGIRKERDAARLRDIKFNIFDFMRVHSERGEERFFEYTGHTLML